MKDSQKIKNNFIVGVLGQLCTLFLGMVVPRLVLTNYGSEVNGLLVSITNIYAYLSLVETGIAASVCQALYKPTAEQNKKQINAILSSANKYYHKTGLIYLGMVVVFAAVYPILIQSEIPRYTIILVILFNGLGNVINHFFHGKYLILLKADGRNYVRTGIDVLTNMVKQITKIVFIAMGYDVVLVQFIAMCTSFVQMAYITYYMKKNYGWIDLKTAPDECAIGQRKNVIIHEVNYLITANVDVVLLTAFTNLKTVSVYSLYNLLFGMIERVLRTVRDSLEFKIAHLFHSNKDAFLKMFRAFEVCYTALAFSLFSVMYIFVLPFIAIYTNGVTDVNYMDVTLPLLFTLAGLLSAGKYPLDAMIHISGHFQQTQNSAIVEATINGVVSLLLIPWYGVAGALLGTILSLLYRITYLANYVNKYIIQRKPLDTYQCWGINLAIFLIFVILGRVVAFRTETYIQLLATCLPYALVAIMIYFGVIAVYERQVLRYILNIKRRNK